MKNTYTLKNSMSLSKVISESRAKTEQVNESGFDFIKAGALATLLAVPGLVKSEELSKGLDSDSNNVVQISSPKTQEKIYNILGKDRYMDAIIVNIIARTLMAEAGGEKSRTSINAVASVIYNRANGDKNSYIDVIHKPKQFSCWNKFNDDDKENFVLRPHKTATTNPSTWAYCVKVAKDMVNGTFEPIANYTHYYAHNKVSPSWKKDMINTRVIGNHTFGEVQG